jgi:membrane dipeptidase
MSYKEQAIELQRRVGMMDAHMDLATELLNRHHMGQSDVIKTYYLEMWRQSGLKILISSIFIENDYLPEFALRTALNQVNLLKREIESLPNDLALVIDKESLDQVIKSDKIGILISFEGLEPIMNDLSLLESFYDLGVRGAGLVWSRRNYVAEGSYFGDGDRGIRGGLSPFGIEVVQKMDAMNMFIDISHLNDEGVIDVFKESSKPILASHSNCRSLNDIKRNLTDDHLRQIAQRGGVIGVNNIRPIVSVDPVDNYINRMCDHIDHMVSVAGIDAVGFGFDICQGIELTHIRYGNVENEVVDVLDGHKDVVHITECLLDRGYSEEDCEKIMLGNMLRFIKNFLE